MNVTSAQRESLARNRFVDWPPLDDVLQIVDVQSNGEVLATTVRGFWGGLFNAPRERVTFRIPPESRGKIMSIARGAKVRVIGTAYWVEEENRDYFHLKVMKCQIL